MKRIHVVAGVIRDAQGRVLLAQRGPDDPLAGLWEFPGGKVEPGEASPLALARELREELDIDVHGLEPLVRVPWQYPDLHVDLEVFRVASHAGTPRGCQGQALRWVALDALKGAAMPAADRPVVAALALPRTCLITSEPAPDAFDGFVARLDLCLAEGTRLVQLRAKALPDAGLRELALRCRQAARRHGAALLINGRPDLCMELDLDGVHVPAAFARQLGQRPVPPERWFGVSCHDAGELARALALQADYVTLGPVMRTASHPGVAPMGWEGFEDLLKDYPLPCFALGGLRPDDLESACGHGAFGIAAIRALWNVRRPASRM